MGKRKDVKPNHYKFTIDGKEFNTIDFIHSVCKHFDGDIAFDVGNMLKYLLRAGLKNGSEDYRKANTYLTFILDNVKENEPTTKLQKILFDIKYSFKKPFIPIIGTYTDIITNDNGDKVTYEEIIQHYRSRFSLPKSGEQFEFAIKRLIDLRYHQCNRKTFYIYVSLIRVIISGLTADAKYAERIKENEKNKEVTHEFDESFFK